MRALDQPLKMHINQERSMKEQMDGIARHLHDKNVVCVDDDTYVSEIIPEEPQQAIRNQYEFR